MNGAALIPVSWRSKPRSFVALMSLYEANYIGLADLCEDPARLSGEYRSLVDGDPELVLTVTESAPYTTTLSLSYLLPQATRDPGGPERFPDVQVRLYTDARLAEARHWADAVEHPALKSLRRDSERELDQRWALNMMLNKWLDYCRDRGHRFGA
jgi:uncharacterized protein